MSHHANDIGRLEKLAKIQTWHVERFAAFLKKLADVPDGDGTLLDHSMFLYGSNMSNSDRHNGHPLPTILVGGGNGTHKGGQHLELREPTPLANLHLTILDKIGAGRKTFGDSTGMIARLLMLDRRECLVGVASGLIALLGTASAQRALPLSRRDDAADRSSVAHRGRRHQCPRLCQPRRPGARRQRRPGPDRRSDGRGAPGVDARGRWPAVRHAVQHALAPRAHRRQRGDPPGRRDSGATIVAHENTRLWMATPVWSPAEDRYRQPRPAAARPDKTFYDTGSMTTANERIEYGYLIAAHTSGDIYVRFRDANVLAVGDVASPARDPELDWFTGAWIGGRVDAMARLLTMCDDRTRIVPGYGPVMTKAQLQAEHDVMKTIYDRVFDLVRKGDESTDMLKAGVLNDLPRTWKDPQRFLYDVQKGLWAHHNKLSPDVV